MRTVLTSRLAICVAVLPLSSACVSEDDFCQPGARCISGDMVFCGDACGMISCHRTEQVWRCGPSAVCREYVERDGFEKAECVVEPETPCSLSVSRCYAADVVEFCSDASGLLVRYYAACWAGP